jgi:cyclic pyranopterin phosphate synthase
VKADAEKRALSLRVSVTDRCQLRCLYCMPPAGVTKMPRQWILSFEEIARFAGLLRSRFGLGKVRITGGEPLVRPGIVRLVRMLVRAGVPEVALTRNGHRLAGLAAKLKRAGLRRVNVSLDSLDPRTYRTLTRGGDLEAALEGIEAAREHGLTPVKVNTVVLREQNLGEVVDLARFALAKGWRIRFLEVMPIGPARERFAEAFVPTSEVRERLEGAFALAPLPYVAGQSSRDFSATDAEGRGGIIGFISSETRPFCSGCNRLRLTSEGRLVSCLARNEGRELRALLRSRAPGAQEALANVVSEALAGKTERGAFEPGRAMVTLGG